MTPQEHLAEISKAAPPLAVTSMTILGFPLSDWVLLLTGIYTICQLALLARWFIASRRSKKAKLVCTADCPARQIE